MIVRPARPTDAPAIAAIADELRARVGDPLGHLTVDAILRDGFGDRPEFEILVAEREATVIGHALFMQGYEPAYAAKGLYLADLSVTAAARGSGAGRALVDALCDLAKARDRVFVWWLTSPNNEQALAFYRHIGVDRTVASISHVRIFGASPNG